MHSSDKTLVETLTRSKIYRTYETAFHDATGLPLTFTPAETWGLPLRDDRNQSPFCQLMASTNKSCSACLELQARLNREGTGATTTLACAFGLSDSVVPVKLGEQLVGYLRTGQVFTRTPGEADFAHAIATLERWGVAVDRAELRAAFFGTRVVSLAQYQAILQLLEIFAQQIGAVSNQVLVAEETQENPQITRAKEYITANLAESLSLADCARASHMSTFYFCKMFKRATGLTFTDYVSRLRTEKAKSLLLDAQVRVSEVAFEVGFQSLSQFNRVFRKITGRSPSDYRRELAGEVRPRPAPATTAPAPVPAAAPTARRFTFGVRGCVAAPRLQVAAG